MHTCTRTKNTHKKTGAKAPVFHSPATASRLKPYLIFALSRNDFIIAWNCSRCQF